MKLDEYINMLARAPSLRDLIDACTEHRIPDCIAKTAIKRHVAKAVLIAYIDQITKGTKSFEDCCLELAPIVKAEYERGLQDEDTKAVFEQMGGER
jgi:hypothetical protein